jgi:hypothetical protein
MFERTWTVWRRLLGQPTRTSTQDVALKDKERRVWIRYPADLEVAVSPACSAENAGIVARVRNISLGGINLLASRHLEPGEMITVELPGATAESRTWVLACVVHCAELKPGEWSLGCTFSRELTHEDLIAFGASRERYASADQREWKRFSPRMSATYQLVSQADLERHAAEVLDICPSGIGLLINHEIDNGSLLSVEMCNAAGIVVRTMLACIVHINRLSPEKWALGCNFIRSLNDEDFKALA